MNKNRADTNGSKFEPSKKTCYSETYQHSWKPQRVKLLGSNREMTFESLRFSENLNDGFVFKNTPAKKIASKTSSPIPNTDEQVG